MFPRFGRIYRSFPFTKRPLRHHSSQNDLTSGPVIPRKYSVPKSPHDRPPGLPGITPASRAPGKTLEKSRDFSVPSPGCSGRVLSRLRAPRLEFTYRLRDIRARNQAKSRPIKLHDALRLIHPFCAAMPSLARNFRPPRGAPLVGPALPIFYCPILSPNLISLFRRPLPEPEIKPNQGKSSIPELCPHYTIPRGDTSVPGPWYDGPARGGLHQIQ